jgi:hypothetical protein
MSEQTQAASSPAEVADVFNGENVSMHEYNKYRQTGEVPERFKPSEAAPAEPTDAEEQGAEQEDTDDSADSAAKDAQEKPNKRRPDVEARFKQLTDTIKDLKAQLDAAKPRETPADSSTAKPEQPPQNYKEWRKTFDEEKWIDQYAAENPEKSFVQATAAMADYLGDVREQFSRLEQQRNEQAKAFSSKVDDARQRYGESFDSTVAPAAKAIATSLGDTPVSRMLNESDYLPDILFTLGGDETAMQDFIRISKENPGKAMRYIATLENEIAVELESASADTGERNDKGQFTSKESPAKPKTSAPKPPTPVSGAASSAFDVSDESLSPEEWMRKRNEDLRKRRA